MLSNCPAAVSSVIRIGTTTGQSSPIFAYCSIVMPRSESPVKVSSNDAPYGSLFLYPAAIKWVSSASMYSISRMLASLGMSERPISATSLSL